MKTVNTQKGFTLVELAIVMTIIGLLIGGILKGQELMENARTTATINQIRAYESAGTTFRDTFGGLPGDLPNAATRIAGCQGTVTGGCSPLAANAGNGNIGANNWSNNGANSWLVQQHSTTQAILQGVAVGAAQTSEAAETGLFWIHLLAADLISGISTIGLTNAQVAQWDTTNPAAKIGGGFVVGVSQTAATNPGAFAAGSIGGTVLVLTASPGGANTTIMGTTAGGQPLTPLRASIIDRKIDDGRPAAGYVHAYGTQASCFSAAGNPVYAETVASKDCGLIIRIQI